MRTRVLLVLICAITIAMPVAAESPPSSPDPDAPPVAVEELVQMALRDNPELSALRSGALAAAERPAQARALPDPRFTWQWMGEHIETVRGPQSATYGLSQELPFFGKRGLRGDIAEQEAGVAAEQVRAMELDVVATVRRLAAEVAYLDQALAIQAEDRRLLDEIREIANTRYTTGQGRLGDVARIEVELAEKEQGLLDLDREREVAAAELNRLLGRDAETPLPRISSGYDLGPELATADSLLTRGDGRPELRAAEARIAGSNAAMKLARRSYFPDLMLGAQYLVVDKGMSLSPEAGTDAWMIEVGVDLPIWFGKLRSGVREAEHMQSQSRATLAAERNRIQSEISAAAARLRRLREIVSVQNERLLPKAELALRSATTSYRSGGIGFLDLLDTERSLIRARLAAARTGADLAQAAAELERVTARPLPTPMGVTP